MQVRSSVAGVALAAMALAGVAACSSDDSSESSATSTTATSSVAGSAAPTSSTEAVSDLQPAAAQQIVRTLVDPATSPTAAAALVDSTDPAIGPKITGFAKGASAGGYTPDVFTVKAVTAAGVDKATAAVAVASPHTPQPVTIAYGFTKVGGEWKLSSDAVAALLGMAGGPR